MQLFKTRKEKIIHRVIAVIMSIPVFHIVTEKLTVIYNILSFVHVWGKVTITLTRRWDFHINNLYKFT
jgi:hypothetical protein